MITQLRRVGDGSALLLDRAIMELVGLEDGGTVQITISNGSLVVTPVNPRQVDQERLEACVDQVVSGRREVLRRLAQ